MAETLVLPSSSPSSSSARRRSFAASCSKETAEAADGRQPMLRLRSPSSASSSASPCPAAKKEQNGATLFFHCSPFVSLTALSAIILLLVPNQFLLHSQQQSSAASSRQEGQQRHFGGDGAEEEQFCCGGGPFSYYAASIVSIPCERHQIHLCCEHHDRCYDQRHLNQSFCDDQFCACLDTIRSSAYCETVAQPSLCLATRVFGHLFHWSANCTADSEAHECLALAEGTTAIDGMEEEETEEGEGMKQNGSGRIDRK